MTAPVAIVGSGLGGFVAYTTLRHAGLRAAEITVFGRDSDPAGAWRPRAAAIRQRLMRSESDGHCAPTSFPGLAVREAARRRDPAPLVLSVLDRYRPTVEEFLRHVAELRERSRWDESFVPARVDRIAAVDGGLEVGGRGVFQHVPRGIRAWPSRTSSRTIRASSTPTSRTSTPRASPSSAPAWPQRRSG